MAHAHVKIVRTNTKRPALQRHRHQMPKPRPNLRRKQRQKPNPVHLQQRVHRRARPSQQLLLSGCAEHGIHWLQQFRSASRSLPMTILMAHRLTVMSTPIAQQTTSDLRWFCQSGSKSIVEYRFRVTRSSSPRIRESRTRSKVERSSESTCSAFLRTRSVRAIWSLQSTRQDLRHRSSRTCLTMGRMVIALLICVFRVPRRSLPLLSLGA